MTTGPRDHEHDEHDEYDVPSGPPDGSVPDDPPVRPPGDPDADRDRDDCDTGELPATMPGAPAQVGPSVSSGSDEPVTVVISRLVRPGYEQAYEDWIHEAARLLSDHEGFQGLTALPPGQHHTGPEHVLVLRFSDYESMRRWKRSEERRRWIAKLPELTVDVGAWQEQSGLETWFVLDRRATPTGPPPRWKQAVLTAVGLIPLLILIDLTVGRLLADLPVWARVLSTTPFAVAAMAWLVMPAITRLAWRWLYPGQDH